MNKYRLEVLKYLDNHGPSRQGEVVNSIVKTSYKSYPLWKYRVKLAVKCMKKEGKLIQVIEGFPPHRILSIPKS